MQIETKCKKCEDGNLMAYSSFEITIQTHLNRLEEHDAEIVEIDIQMHRI